MNRGTRKFPVLPSLVMISLVFPIARQALARDSKITDKAPLRAHEFRGHVKSADTIPISKPLPTELSMTPPELLNPFHGPDVSFFGKV
jgi:hypothetical protein